MRWLVLLALVLPLASSQAPAPFAGSMEDRPDDVVTRAFRPHEEPTTDIRSFTSRIVEGTLVEQRVTMAEPPSVERNSIIVRSWFRNSTNGSFYTLDLEVHSLANESERFVAYTRRGAFENVTQVDATWRLEGRDWVFGFDGAEVAPDAECFLPQIYAYLPEANGSGAFDSSGMGGRPCATSPEPGNAAPGSRTPRFPPIVADMPDAEGEPAAPRVEAPGSRTPPPSLPLALGIGAAVVGALLLARASTKR